MHDSGTEFANEFLEKFSVQELLSYHLIRLGRRLDLLQSRIAHREGLSLIGLKLLFLFDTRTPSTLTDAIRETSLDPGQASRAVQQLLDLGLISQSRTEGDKRRKQILLTEAGNAVVRRSLATRMRIETMLCELVGEDRLEETKAALEEMIDHLGDLDQFPVD